MDEVVTWIAERSVQKSSVAAFMSKYCRYPVYWENFANIMLWQHHKIYRSISSLRRKCSFIPKSDIKRCPSATEPFFRAGCTTGCGYNMLYNLKGTSYGQSVGMVYRSKSKRRTAKASSWKDSSTVEAVVNHNAFPHCCTDLKLLISTCKLYYISVFTDK